MTPKKKSTTILISMVAASIICYVTHEIALDHDNMILAMLTTIASVPLLIIGMGALFDVLGLNKEHDKRNKP